jgi:glycosyltransferase involved in cell wall biosynthesis
MPAEEPTTTTTTGAPERPHVLICAAMCHPDIGSEYAVGWQWVCQAAKHHRVTVIAGDARGTRVAVERELASRPELAANVNFIFLPWFDPPRSKLLQAVWTKVPNVYYWFYRRWLEQAAGVARKVVAQERIDLIHLVTLTCYREPGVFWDLGRPFVWGPVGGTQDVPWAFLPALGIVEGTKHGARNVFNWIYFRWSGAVRRAMRRAAVLSAMASDTQRAIEERFARASVVIPATACSPEFGRGDAERSRNRPPRFVFSGHHISRKGLPFALHALAGLRELPWTLDVLGDGPLSRQWRGLAERLGIGDRVRFLGKVPRADAIRAMAEGDAFVFPTLQEGWPTVVIEALSLGLPVVTTNQHGMADMIDADCGFLTRVDRPAHLIADLRQALRILATDRALLDRLSAGARRRAEVFSAARQEAAICELYARAMTNRANG